MVKPSFLFCWPGRGPTSPTCPAWVASSRSPAQSMYGASKTAVKLLTEGLYAELLETDVRVSVIMPVPSMPDHTELGLPVPWPEDASRMPMTSAEDAAFRSCWTASPATGSTSSSAGMHGS